MMEDEYRFISFSKKKYDFINIENCINGIIVSLNNLKEWQVNKYVEFAEENNIELLFISWSQKGFDLEGYKEYIRFLNIVQEIFNNSTANENINKL